MSETHDNRLGPYLRDRRAKLDPSALGLPATRRRTPGLRREEVAQRAHISATWYTWLEQGRGGAPSADVLERIAQALMLTEAEREHVFLLALGRPPESQYQPCEGVTHRLQRVLDAFAMSPAIVRTPIWDVVAWNRAATVVLSDYAAIPAEQRNVLRLMFCNDRVRAAQTDWETVARFVVASFRADVARAHATEKVQALVDELCHSSPEFAAMWRDNDVIGHGGGTKELQHPTLGTLALEFSGFAVDGRPDLSMLVYNPATEADRDKIRTLLEAETPAG